MFVSVNNTRLFFHLVPVYTQTLLIFREQNYTQHCILLLANEMCNGPTQVSCVFSANHVDHIFQCLPFLALKTRHRNDLKKRKDGRKLSFRVVHIPRGSFSHIPSRAHMFFDKKWRATYHISAAGKFIFECNRKMNGGLRCN